jgi:cytochrome c-type biogenesis protein
MGLAVPFLFSAIAFTIAARGFRFFKRHYVAIQLGSGAVLIVMGYLVLTGQLFELNIQAQHFLGHLGLNFFQSV